MMLDQITHFDPLRKHLDTLQSKSEKGRNADALYQIYVLKKHARQAERLYQKAHDKIEKMAPMSPSLVAPSSSSSSSSAVPAVATFAALASQSQLMPPFDAMRMQSTAFARSPASILTPSPAEASVLSSPSPAACSSRSKKTGPQLLGETLSQQIELYKQIAVSQQEQGQKDLALRTRELELKEACIQSSLGKRTAEPSPHDDHEFIA
jgi:hypothetical protein